MNSTALETDWRYFPTEVMDAAYGMSELDESSWGVLAQLSDYPRNLIAISGVLNLRHTFDLEPITDVCVQIHLHLEHAPTDTQVYINGWHVGTSKPAEVLHADITDYVSLEDNLILLKLTRSGDLGGLFLQRVPCES